MANFTDRLAEVYEDRTVFLLDRPLYAAYFRGDVISFRDLNRLVRRAANVLRAVGVRRGDRVALATLNRIEPSLLFSGFMELIRKTVYLTFVLLLVPVIVALCNTLNRILHRLETFAIIAQNNYG